jgi:hypothetical protein
LRQGIRRAISEASSIPFPVRLVFAALALSIGAVSFSPAASESPASPTYAGVELGTLTIGKRTYEDVRVSSRDARSVFFRHRGGIGSARLRELPAEAQARLGFDPESAPPEPPPPPPPKRSSPPPSASPTAARAKPPSASAKLDELFLAYDQAPELRLRQSLQPEFIRLGLVVKNQGRRPSCAVYAVVSALEFQNARLTGSIEKLSEEYLIWATRRSLGLSGPGASLLRDPASGDFTEDTGFTLPSVIAGLQIYGIPAYEDMRNQPGLAAAAVPEPSPEIIARARDRRRVFISPLPGREPAVVIPRIIHALNAELPVPLGLLWPHENTIHAGVLRAQQAIPGAGHAVTVVGYECSTGVIEDTVFIFKNSYGPRWGQGGYGRVSYGYLQKNLLDAYVLDVRPAKPTSP